MTANRTGAGKTEPEYPKPNRLRFTKKPEKPETGQTETTVLNRFPKIQKIQTRRSLEIRISRLREYARIPQGGGRSPPPLGIICIL